MKVKKCPRKRSMPGKIRMMKMIIRMRVIVLIAAGSWTRKMRNVR